MISNTRNKEQPNAFHLNASAAIKTSNLPFRQHYATIARKNPSVDHQLAKLGKKWESRIIKIEIERLDIWSCIADYVVTCALLLPDDFVRNRVLVVLGALRVLLKANVCSDMKWWSQWVIGVWLRFNSYYVAWFESRALFFSLFSSMTSFFGR